MIAPGLRCREFMTVRGRVRIPNRDHGGHFEWYVGTPAGSQGAQRRRGEWWAQLPTHELQTARHRLIGCYDTGPSHATLAKIGDAWRVVGDRSDGPRWRIVIAPREQAIFD